MLYDFIQNSNKFVFLQSARSKIIPSTTKFTPLLSIEKKMTFMLKFVRCSKFLTFCYLDITIEEVLITSKLTRRDGK